MPLAGRTRSGLRLLGALLAAVLLTIVPFALEACSTSGSASTGAANSSKNVRYVRMGSLTYTILAWRTLDLKDPHDASYLVGVPPARLALARGESWFVVFLQVHNSGSSQHLAAKEATISDSHNKVYIPVVPFGTDPLSYQRYAYYVPVPPGGQIPPANTIAARGPDHAVILLYKLEAVSLRGPLQINIVSATEPPTLASATLGP